MLASESLIDALNAQVGREMAASMQYICIATYFDDQALPELAAFFYRQSDEEREHAMRFVKFLVDVGGKVEIPHIAASSSSFESAEVAVQTSLEWEEEVTRQIYELVEIAQNDKNYIAQRFLDWFVNEQLEEVSIMGDLLQVVRRAGSDGLFHVEDYLARNPLVPEEEDEG